MLILSRSRFLADVLEFARTAHGDQKRKYTNAPYIEHPIEVAAIVGCNVDDPEVIAAAYLHDTVEDTLVTLDQIGNRFGHRVMSLVEEVTDISKPEHGNRETRKAMDRAHLAKASAYGKVIKLADLISNTSSIVAYDVNFAKVYLREKALLLPLLDTKIKFGQDIYIRAWHVLREARRELVQDALGKADG